MTNRAVAPSNATRIILVLLLLSGRTASLRLTGQKPPRQQVLSEMGNAKTPSKADVEEAVKKGVESAANLTCKDLPPSMNLALGQVVQLFEGICPNSVCTLPLQGKTRDALVGEVSRLTTLAALADTKNCLDEVMKDSAVQQRTADVHGFWNSTILGVKSEEQRAQMEEAWEQLQIWKHNVQQLSGSILDRELLFPENIEHPVVCPSPCKTCSREHNSWYKRPEQFKFKCILDSADQPPDESQLVCEKPRRRWSKPWEAKSWCEVRDWRAKAFQKATVESHLTCAAMAIVAPLVGLQKMPESTYVTCLLAEQGAAMPEEDMNTYQRFSQSLRSAQRSYGDSNAIFAVFMTIGLADALGSMRDNSDGNELPLVRHPLDEHNNAYLHIGLLSKCEPPNLHVGHAFMAVGKVVTSTLLLGLLGVPAAIIESFPFRLLSTVFLVLITLIGPFVAMVLVANIVPITALGVFSFLATYLGAFFNFALGLLGGGKRGDGYLTKFYTWWWKLLEDRHMSGALNSWLGPYISSPDKQLPEATRNCPASHFMTKLGQPECLKPMNFGDSAAFRCGGPNGKWISVNCSSQYGGTMVVGPGC